MVAPGNSAKRRVRHRRSHRQRPVWRRDEDEGEVDSDSDDDDDDEVESQTIASVPPPPPSSTSTSTSISTFLPPAVTTLSETTPLVTSSPTPFASPVSTSSESISTVWLTTTASGTSPIAETSAASSIIVVGQQNGNDRNGGDANPYQPPPNNNKFAVAFGVVGAVGFLVGLIWAALMIRRRRRRRRNGDQPSVNDFTSTIGKPNRFCKWPFGGRSTSSTATSSTPSFGNWGVARRTLSMPFGGGNKVKRSDASIMDEAIQAAYGGDRETTIPKGFLDEKKHDPNYPLPLLEPEPILQASIRQSLVSWFKRSSRHHPLKLSPMSRWSRSTRASTFHSEAAGNNRVPSQYSASVYSDRDSIPPIPPLNIKRANNNNNNNNPPPAGPSELPATPEPVFTRDDAQAYYKTMYHSESERMSTASSWTDATRSTMRVSAAPVTAGLSPPTYYSNRNTLTDMTTLTEGCGGGGGSTTAGMQGDWYEQAAAGEGAAGLGLQRFDTMGQK